MKISGIAVLFVLLSASKVLHGLPSGKYLTFSAVSCVFGWHKLTLSEEEKDKIKNKPVQDYVFFYLYTKENPEGQEIGPYIDMNSTSFNLSRPTKFIVHGYKKSKESESVVVPRDALLRSGDYNIIVVDWSDTHLINGKIPNLYAIACAWVPQVGVYLTAMIDFLAAYGMDLKTTTLIGHSLGAHVVGIAGFNNNKKVGTIFGLDPAGPKFESKDVDDRLSTYSANTVIAIHTNEGDCGISKEVGHYDFYPNGGRKQPGCLINSCHHARAFELYAESIVSNVGFYGKLCPDLESAQEENCTGDTVRMDENVRKHNASQGIYYFETNKSSPFAKGKRH